MAPTAASVLRRIPIILLAAAVIFLALIGAYSFYSQGQHAAAAGAAQAVETTWSWDPGLLYNRNGGEPLLLVRPGNRISLIFFEGFRTQNPAGMYRDWFQELHERYGVNIFVPVYGLQSSPFALRNRGWDHHEDLRTGLMAYEAFVANLSPDHRVVTVSQSFGALPHAAILARAARKPDAAAFLSPLNAGLDFRASGELVRWLSTQTAWLKYVIPFTVPSPAPGRASVWDIADPELNRQVAARFPVNPEDSAEYGDRMPVIAAELESFWLPAIQGRDILVATGTEDLYFSQAGFARFAAILSGAGNRVSRLELAGSGHMVLLDRQAPELKAVLLNLLRPETSQPTSGGTR